MSIKVVLYGDLTQIEQLKTNKRSNPLTINIAKNDVNAIYDILEKLHINEQEISHIFVNHNYYGPGKEIKEGDRIALFPKRMALMFVEIPHSNSIEVKVKLSTDLRKFGPEESRIDIPEGSNITKIIKSYNLTNGDMNLQVKINGIPCHEERFTLKQGDIVEIFTEST